VDYQYAIGDVVLVWGRSFVANALRFVISRIFGVADAPNHAEVVISKNRDISAEPEGVILKDRAKTFREAKKIIAIRHKGMTEDEQVNLIADAWKYRGKGYDYYNHARWFLMFLAITAPIIYFVTDPLRKWLRRESKTRWHCTELTAQLLSDAGIECGYEDFSHVPPHHFLHLAIASSDWEIVYIYEEK